MGCSLRAAKMFCHNRQISFIFFSTAVTVSYPLGRNITNSWHQSKGISLNVPHLFTVTYSPGSSKSTEASKVFFFPEMSLWVQAVLFCSQIMPILQRNTRSLENMLNNQLNNGTDSNICLNTAFHFCTRALMGRECGWGCGWGMSVQLFHKLDTQDIKKVANDISFNKMLPFMALMSFLFFRFILPLSLIFLCFSSCVCNCIYLFIFAFSFAL